MSLRGVLRGVLVVVAVIAVTLALSLAFPALRSPVVIVVAALGTSSLLVKD